MKKEILSIGKFSSITTNTYMNLFDYGFWKHYTNIQTISLKMEIKGKGYIQVYSGLSTNDTNLINKAFESSTFEEINIPVAYEEGVIFFKVHALEPVLIKNASFYSKDILQKEKDINLALIICTYKRKNELDDNLKEIKCSDFFLRSSALYGKLKIYIIDNSSQLNMEEYNSEHIKLFHNSNTGGSGGFTRGIHECRKDTAKNHISHVIFMDDDAMVLSESFHRLYALLSCVQTKYCHKVVAGRMFRMDQREIQYTACEIWNKGDIQHVGFQTNMSNVKNLNNINYNYGEYSGWWFACFSMKFVMKNDPLPFFLHCDDVEYGLRHGGSPLILNGIQVWHITHEYKYSPVMKYYDNRNRWFVNSIYEHKFSETELFHSWKESISKEHIKKDYLSEYMLILAFWHYLKGMQLLYRINSEKLQEKLLHKKGHHLENAFFWRICSLKFKIYNFKHKRKDRKIPVR